MNQNTQEVVTNCLAMEFSGREIARSTCGDLVVKVTKFRDVYVFYVMDKALDFIDQQMQMSEVKAFPAWDQTPNGFERVMNVFARFVQMWEWAE